MKKFLALLLAAIMALALCACGSDSGVSAASDDYSAPPGNSETVDVGAPATPDEPDGSETQPDTGGSTDTETTDPTGNFQPDEPAAPVSNPVTPNGLILMTTTDTNLRDPKISCINVETGEATVIAEFNFAPKTLQDTIFYFPGAGFSCGHREWFASDYSKIAVTMTDTQSGQSCAGWIGTDGEFFNVSEALGQLNRGDFDDPAVYLAVGFTDDGFFVYRQTIGSGTNAETSYHYVPMDNLDPSEIRDGVPFPGYDEDGLGLKKGVFSKVTVSDYIGDTRYLINTSDGVSQIFDTATGTRTDYVPGTGRFSWHGVLSPDGSQVAFMSQPKSGIEKDLYIMPLEGGDPVKIPTDGFSLSSQQGCETGHDYGSQITMLVDWR